jgi:hypothetical protein
MAGGASDCWTGRADGPIDVRRYQGWMKKGNGLNGKDAERTKYPGSADRGKLPSRFEQGSWRGSGVNIRVRLDHDCVENREPLTSRTL